MPSVIEGIHNFFPNEMKGIRAEAYLALLGIFLDTNENEIKCVFEHKDFYDLLTKDFIDDDQKVHLILYVMKMGRKDIQTTVQDLSQKTKYITEFFPNEMKEFNMNMYMSFLDDLIETDENKIQAVFKYKDLFTPNLKAEIVLESLSMTLEKIKERTEQLQKKEKYITKLFPNGVKEISAKTYMYFLDNLIDNDENKIQTVCKYKDLFTPNVIDDELKASFFSYLLSEKSKDIEEMAKGLSGTAQYITALFPKGIGKISLKAYIEFMPFFSLFDKEDVEKIFDYWKLFITKDMMTEMKLAMGVHLLHEDFYGDLKSMEDKLKDKLEGKIQYIPTLFPKGIEKGNYFSEGISNLDSENFWELMVFLAESNKEQIQSLAENADIFFSEDMENYERLGIMKIFKNSNSETITKIAEYIDKSVLSWKTEWRIMNTDYLEGLLNRYNI